jgi:hypothetical protein
MSQFSTAAEYTLYQANRFYRREPLTAPQEKTVAPHLGGQMAVLLTPARID